MESLEEVLEHLDIENVSDLHLTADKKPAIRKNNELVIVEEFPEKLSHSKINRIIENLLTPEKLTELKKIGEVDLSYNYNKYRFRMNIYEDYHSMALAIRVITQDIPTMRELKLPEVIGKLVDKKKGLVLCTGPTGSGKSTTLAALIDKINRNQRKHIITLEDPIEYIYKDKKSIIHQREVHNNTRSFPKGLRSALRQDPDVILIGELRDLETIKIALEAADTGHLVLSTLHTNDAPQTVERIVDVFPGNQQEQVKIQLANTLQAVVSQQLLPRKDKKGLIVSTGILLRSPAVANLIREGKAHQLNSTIQSSKQQGMIMFDDYLKKLYRKDLIDIDTAVSHANDAKNFVNQLQRG